MVLLVENVDLDFIVQDLIKRHLALLANMNQEMVHTNVKHVL